MLQVPATSGCASVHQEYDVHPRRFTLALSYREQLTNGIKNVFSLSRIGREWGAHATIPYVINSMVIGVPRGNSSVPVDLFLDFDEINSDLQCSKYRLPEIVSFNHFLQYATRNITYIHIAWDGKQVDFNEESVIRCNDWATEHHGELQTQLGMINGLAKLAKEPGFQITSTCCIDKLKPIDPKVMIDNCGLLDHEKSTVVFDEWRAHTKKKHEYRVVIPSIPWNESPHPDNDAYPVTEAVIKNATAFKKSFAADNDFIAVHIRTVKMAIRLSLEDSKECIVQLFQVVDNLTASSHLSCFYFVDYGPYSVEPYEKKRARLVILQLEDVRHIAPTHYDPSKFNGLKNSAFVSLVEKHAMAHAKFLVLAGRGSLFQLELSQTFKEKSKDGHLQRVC